MAEYEFIDLKCLDCGSTDIVIRQDVTSYWIGKAEIYDFNEKKTLSIIFDAEIDIEPLEDGTVICNQCDHSWDINEFRNLMQKEIE